MKKLVLILFFTFCSIGLINFASADGKTVCTTCGPFKTYCQGVLGTQDVTVSYTGSAAPGASCNQTMDQFNCKCTANSGPKAGQFITQWIYYRPYCTAC